jgi:hypothetical protein
MANKLDLADAQLLGYFNHKMGVRTHELISAMGLTRKEWKKLKSEYGCSYMYEEDIAEIDKYFKEKKKSKPPAP